MNNINDLEKKYIELLLKKCLNFEKTGILFISYNPGNIDFVNKLVEKAKSMFSNNAHLDIYLEEDDLYQKHDLLSKLSMEEITTHPFFNKSKWDEYAAKGASFLVLETEIPCLMDDIDPEKVAKAAYVERTTKPLYKKLQLSYQIPWCFAALPNKKWADSIYQNDDNSYEKLFVTICQMCMVDTNNPIQSWNKYISDSSKRIERLNNLDIKALHYKNGLGTDLMIGMPEGAQWNSAGILGKDMFVNMPSYEVFSTPNMYKTNGIVYSSRPLVYNGGLIDDFFIEFKNGKVVNVWAKKGLAILRGIVDSDAYSRYLGEVALISNDSPISKTGLVFGNSMFDENASCHLALGNGFPECIKNGDNMSQEELNKRGINQSKIHVDFMIGTEDLDITADTSRGKTLLLKRGHFNI